MPYRRDSDRLDKDEVAAEVLSCAECMRTLDSHMDDVRFLLAIEMIARHIGESPVRVTAEAVMILHLEGHPPMEAIIAEGSAMMAERDRARRWN